MASSGSNGGGCLLAVAFGVLVVLPVMILGDDFSWGTLFLIWLILAVIVAVVVLLVTYAIKQSKTHPSKDNGNAVTQADGSASALLSNHLLNVAMTDRYRSQAALEARLEKEIAQYQANQKRAVATQQGLEKELEDIKKGKGKPVFTSKKRYLKQNQEGMEDIARQIAEKQAETETLEQSLVAKRERTANLKFIIFDKGNPEFEQLKSSFEKWKQSISIQGTPDIKASSISAGQRDADLQHVQYQVEPIGIELENHRFYIFPNGIWAFQGAGIFAGVYRPKALQCTFHATERTHYGSGRREFYQDSRIVQTRHTWMYTRNDGGPDRRYKDNPMITITDYMECSFDLCICGKTFHYTVSSMVNCEALEKAINAYAQVKEEKDEIPVLLNLLGRCDESDDTVRQISEMLAEQ